MIHLNGNLLCAIDVETTGLDPQMHEITQVCILPLDSKYRPHKDFTWFDLKIKPLRPENVDPAAMKVTRKSLHDVLLNGMDPHVAAGLFDEWFERLGLAERKRISPLAQNWMFDSSFVRNWLGPENFGQRIDGRYRDTMTVALYLNDRAEQRAEQVPFPKVNLRYIATELGVEWEDREAHDAVYDCMKTAEVYRKLLKMRLGMFA